MVIFRIPGFFPLRLTESIYLKMDQKRKPDLYPLKYRARACNNESQHSQESASNRSQRTGAEQKPFKKCFAATHCKSCTKADLLAS